MPITPSQLSSILRVKKEFNLVTGDLTLTDLTDFAGYGVIAPDTASIILKLVAPTGAIVYQNIGYDTDNFGSPDFDLTTSVLNKTIPQDVNGNYITGSYTLYLKAQVVEGVDNVTTSSIIQQSASALPNNVLTQGAATPPPFSTVKLFVLGNVSTALMHEGDIYQLEVNGDIVSYTVPSSTQTVQQFYNQLYLAILDYQVANPLSDWNNVAGSFGSSTGQYWLNLNRTDGAVMSLGITYTPSGTPQISNVAFYTTPNGTAPLVGDILGITFSGETITYQVQIGDDLGAAITGLYDAIQQYISANPSSDWATYLIVTNGYSFIRLQYVTGNTPFVVTSSVTATTTPVITSSGEKSTISNVCGCSVTVSIDLSVDYATALLTSVDTTNYGPYVSLTRVHTIYPPPISGLPSQTTSATTNVYSNIVTTTWSSKVASTIVYLYANDTYVTCYAEGSKEILVEPDTLCATLCIIKKFRADFYSKFGKKCSDDMEAAYNLACDEFALAMQAARCGQDITPYVNKIYEITGIDPNCDCGCSGSDYPTPVVPTSIINGTDGTDGITPQFQNTGTWIQVSYNNGSTWNNLFSLASVTGAAGPQGPAGTDGANGTTVLYNSYPNASTTTNVWEKLGTYQLPAATLTSNGDEIVIKTVFTTNTKPALPSQLVKQEFNSVALNTPLNIGFAYSNTSKISIETRLSRTSNTNAKYQMYVMLYGSIIGGGLAQQAYFQDLQNIAGLNFTTTAYDIDAYANSDSAGDITLESFEVLLYKK